MDKKYEKVFMTLFILVVISALILGLRHSSLEQPVDHKFNSSQKVSGVVRILMHKPNEFTVFVKDQGPELTQYEVGSRQVKFIADVPQDQEMWFLQNQIIDYPEGANIRTSLEFHIHDAADINPAGWKERKYKHTVKGDSVVIE